MIGAARIMAQQVLNITMAASQREKAASQDRCVCAQGAVPIPNFAVF
jgi:hypothetical protein